MSNGLPIIGTGMKITTFIMEMRKRDLLLVGFIGLFFLLIGALTGQIPSPLLTATAQHAQMFEEHSNQANLNRELVNIARLQLYLGRETCLHGAKTESEKSRCDRKDIRDAIISDILNTNPEL